MAKKKRRSKLMSQQEKLVLIDYMKTLKPGARRELLSFLGIESACEARFELSDGSVLTVDGDNERDVEDGAAYMMAAITKGKEKGAVQFPKILKAVYGKEPGTSDQACHYVRYRIDRIAEKYLKGRIIPARGFMAENAKATHPGHGGVGPSFDPLVSVPAVQPSEPLEHSTGNTEADRLAKLILSKWKGEPDVRNALAFLIRDPASWKRFLARHNRRNNRD